MSLVGRVFASRMSVAVAASLLTLLVAGSIAFAAIPNSQTKVISTCYKSNGGAMRVINAQKGEQCATGERSLNFSQGIPVGLQGTRLFSYSSTWTAPPGVTRVLLELWGAGGGGGCSGPTSSSGGGGGGGGGGYLRVVATVVPGEIYRVQVGARGDGCGAAPATSGGNTAFRKGSTVLASALGGRAGSDGLADGSGGAGGRGGRTTGAENGLENTGGDGSSGTDFGSEFISVGGETVPGTIGNGSGFGAPGGFPGADNPGSFPSGGLAVLLW